MKRAVKWPSKASTSVDRQPGRKEQDGRHRPVEKGSGRIDQMEKSRMVDVDQEKSCVVDVDRQWSKLIN